MSRIPTPSEVARDPVLFARTFLKVLDKNQRIVPLIYNPAQSDFLANRTHRDLVLKARQLGFSTAIQGEFFRYVTTSTAITMTLAHEDETTQKLRRMANRFYDYLPLEFRPVRKYANTRLATYPAFDSESVIATAGNAAAGRGGTYSHLHGSEVAFWKDAESLLSGAMQGGNPIIALESTPNGAGGFFYERCMAALDGDTDWRLHFYAWWWDASYQMPLEDGEEIHLTGEEVELANKHSLSPEQIKWRRAKQRELKHLFAQEYPEDPVTCFLTSIAGYFGDVTPYCTAQMREPNGDMACYAGLDFGQSEDYTVLSIIDSVSGAQTAVYRWRRMSWRDMRQLVMQACARWQVKEIMVESNSMGSVNIENMTDDFHQAGLKTTIRSFFTSNASKSDIMMRLHEALESGDLKLLNDPIQRHELLIFAATPTPSGVLRLSAPAGQHDDTVIALALAWNCRLGSRISLRII